MFLVIISKLAVMLMSYNRGVTISCWEMANKPWLPTAGSLNWFTPTVCIGADLENGFFSLKDFLSSASITPLFTQEFSNTYKHLCNLFTKKNSKLPFSFRSHRMEKYRTIHIYFYI